MGRKQVTTQTNFASGELTDALDGRSDLERYYNGARTMLNWQPVVQGGARRAAGTIFVDELFGTTRLLAFEASAADAYLFALQAASIKIYKADTLIQTIVAPWAEADLFDIDFAQALDTCVFTHQDYAPRRLTRVGDVFTLTDLSAVLTGIPTFPAVLRWFGSLYHFIGDYILPPEASDDGYYYICTQEGLSGSSNPTWGAGTITDGGVRWTRAGLVADIQAWSVANGWPRCCTFFQDRLLFAGCPLYPNQIWGSQSGDYFNFSLGIGLDDQGINREILADKLPVIQWVYPGRKLVIGTNLGEFAVLQSTPITPGSFQITPQTAIGSARISPVDVDGAVLHVTNNRKQLRELLYGDIEQAFSTKSLSLLAPSAVSGVVQLAAKASVDFDAANTVFAVNADGSVGVLSTLRDQSFQAWNRRTFNGRAEAVAAVQNTIYIVVSYTYGPGVYEDGVYESGVYEDSGASSNRFLCKIDDDARMDFQKTVTSGTAVTTWAGFEHLAGSTVQTLVDGLYAGDFEVAVDGTITTDFEGGELKAGIAIPEPTLELMPVAFDKNIAGISHILKRLLRCLVQLQDTSSLVVNGDVIPFRGAEDAVDEPIPEFSGVKDLTMRGYDREATVVFTAPDPLPATILSVTREVVI